MSNSNSTHDAHPNGVDGNASRFDPNFTDSVINAVGPKANPRLAKIMNSLTRHLHDWMRENEITLDEYMTGIDLINRAGQMSDDKRNEGLLLADVFGLESLADEITSKLTTETDNPPTATAILGPFWRKDAPIYSMGQSIVASSAKQDDRELTSMSGAVVDFDTGKPIEKVELDVWQSATNGLYENQDPEQPDMNLRGRFYTGADGKYQFYCLRPTKYPIPDDGPAGEVLHMLDRHPWRPAHIHFKISAPGYKPIVTQIFDRNDEHINNDVAFAVKDSLVVDFPEINGESKSRFGLEYNFRLVSLESAKKHGMKG